MTPNRVGLRDPGLAQLLELTNLPLLQLLLPQPLIELKALQPPPLVRRQLRIGELLSLLFAQSQLFLLLIAHEQAALNRRIQVLGNCRTAPKEPHRRQEPPNQPPHPPPKASLRQAGLRV